MGHAGGNNGSGQTSPIKNIGITATASDLMPHGNTDLSCCCIKPLNHRILSRELHSWKILLDLKIQFRNTTGLACGITPFINHLAKCLLNLCGQVIQFFRGMTAHFTHNHHLFGNNIRGCPAMNGAEVSCGLFINPATRSGCKGLPS